MRIQQQKKALQKTINFMCPGKLQTVQEGFQQKSMDAGRSRQCLCILYCFLLLLQEKIKLLEERGSHRRALLLLPLHKVFLSDMNLHLQFLIYFCSMRVVCLFICFCFCVQKGWDKSITICQTVWWPAKPLIPHMLKCLLPSQIAFVLQPRASREKQTCNSSPREQS